MSRRIAVVDNRDSFVHTIVSYLTVLGADVEMYPADDVPPDLVSSNPAGVLVSPGPGTPSSAGSSLDVIAECTTRDVPMLGVCLGHQALAQYYGATIGGARELIHGDASLIDHDGNGVFTGIPSPFSVTRYHSLAIERDTIPAELIVTAHSADGTVMAIAHASKPLVGVQFHPESILSEYGHRLFANWLVSCGLDSALDIAIEMETTRTTGARPL